MKKYIKGLLLLLLPVLFYISYITWGSFKNDESEVRTSASSIWVENWKSHCISEVDEAMDIQIPYYDFEKTVINQSSLSIPSVENLKILNYTLNTAKHDQYNLNTLNIKISFKKPGKYHFDKIQFTQNNIKETHNIGSWDFEVKPQNNTNDLRIISYSIGIISQEDIKQDYYSVTVKNLSNKNIFLKNIYHDFDDFITKKIQFTNGTANDFSQWEQFASEGISLKPQELKTLKIEYALKENRNFNYFFKPALLYTLDGRKENLKPLPGRIIAREANEAYLKQLQTK